MESTVSRSVLSVTLTSLAATFQRMADPRRAASVINPLSSIVSPAVAAILADHLSVIDIAEWGAHHAPEALEQLGFPAGRTPSSSWCLTMPARGGSASWLRPSLRVRLLIGAPLTPRADLSEPTTVWRAVCPIPRSRTGTGAADGDRFDALTRALGDGRSRRGIVKRLTKGLGVAARSRPPAATAPAPISASRSTRPGRNGASVLRPRPKPRVSVPPAAPMRPMSARRPTARSTAPIFRTMLPPQVVGSSATSGITAYPPVEAGTVSSPALAPVPHPLAKAFDRD
jgi:hypothetical protein